MASVWVARQTGKHGFEKLVAVKTILAAHAHDARFQQMFLDEARIASRIEHTNVAQILDLGDEHDVLYLVMEWVNGDSLSRLHRAVQKKGQKLPLGIVLRVLADACGGLHAAHELRDGAGVPLSVVHRDVSPQNILVSEVGIAKVIDFGIAVARDRIARETRAGTFKGKLQYMAPEQALGQRVNRRADVWAIGSVLYFLAEGRAPFEGENELALLHQLTSGAPPAPLSATIPAPVREIVSKALAIDRDQRFASSAELQRALEWAMGAAGLVTTVADVACFCDRHLADRSLARRKCLAVALDAAAERARVQTLLKQHSDATNSTVGSAHALALQGPTLVASSPPGDHALGSASTLAVHLPPHLPILEATIETPADGANIDRTTVAGIEHDGADFHRTSRSGRLAGAALLGALALVGVVRAVSSDKHPLGATSQAAGPPSSALSPRTTSAGPTTAASSADAASTHAVASAAASTSPITTGTITTGTITTSTITTPANAVAPRGDDAEPNAGRPAWAEPAASPSSTPRLTGRPRPSAYPSTLKPKRIDYGF